jgi:hypothetical protein
MKKMLQINLLVFLMVSVSSVSSYAQQKPSERSFTSVVSEIKQKQAMQNKTLQQVKRTTPATSSQNTNMQRQAASGNTGERIVPHPTERLEGTTVQQISNKPLTPQPKSSTKTKKE